MTNEQLAQKYSNRLSKCLAAVKILMICAIVAVAALVIFALIALVTKMQDSNPDGVLLGAIIPGMMQGPRRIRSFQRIFQNLPECPASWKVPGWYV